MVHGGSVLWMNAMTVRKIVVSASDMVPMVSALGNSAPRPLLFKEGVASTGTLRTKNECKVEGCDTAVIKRGLCTKHGAQGRCKFVGCTTNASLHVV